MCCLVADETMFRDFHQIHLWAQAATGSVSRRNKIGFFKRGGIPDRSLGNWYWYLVGFEKKNSAKGSQLPTVTSQVTVTACH